jgi:hypothetical protein
VERGQSVHRQRRRLFGRHPLRSGDDGRGRDDDERRLRAALDAPRSDGRHRLVADGEVLNAVPDRLDHARGVHPRHPGQRQLVVAALPEPDVRRVDGRGPDREPHLARTRLADLALHHGEDLRPAGSRDPDGACRRHSRSSRSATVSSVTCGRRPVRQAAHVERAADPAPDEHRHGAAQVAERDVE